MKLLKKPRHDLFIRILHFVIYSFIRKANTMVLKTTWKNEANIHLCYPNLKILKNEANIHLYFALFDASPNTSV